MFSGGELLQTRAHEPIKNNQMKKLIIITVCALSFYYCGKFDYEQQQLIKSGLTAKELQMFPNWLAADSVAGDARFGDLWCEIASGKEIEL